MAKLITLSQSLLDFVNLREIESVDDADDIFRKHSHFLWNRLSPDDHRGRASIVDLRDESEDRLAELIRGRKASRNRVLRQVLAELPNASAQAVVQGIELPLVVVPTVTEVGGCVTVKNRWLVTGVHCAVMLGFLELFVDDLLTKLARCGHCQRFYFRSARLRSACSPACRHSLRMKAVARHVKKWRQRRNRQARR